MRRIVQVLRLPSFATRDSFEVHMVGLGSGAEFVGTRLSWVYEEDVLKFWSPTERLRHPDHLDPTLKEASGLIDAETGHQLARDVESLTVPIEPRERHVGEDGVAHALATGDRFGGVTIRWWESAPARWAPIESLARRVVDIVTLDSREG